MLCSGAGRTAVAVANPRQAEMKRITPWGDTYDGLTAGGLEVEVERRYIWAHQPEGAIAIEVEVRLPGTRQGAEARAVIEPSR